MLVLHKYSLPPLPMNRSDDYVHDLVPTQKLEWVTPRISLMEVGDTYSKAFVLPQEFNKYQAPS